MLAGSLFKKLCLSFSLLESTEIFVENLREMTTNHRKCSINCDSALYL